MLTILTRDESFHVPLNVHFLREALARNPGAGRLRLRLIHHLLYLALQLSAVASRRKAQAFDQIPLKELSRAYAEQLARLFVEEDDLDLTPHALLLWMFGLKRQELRSGEGISAVSVRAAEDAADRERVVVSAL
jgi:hypothetical protein